VVSRTVTRYVDTRDIYYVEADADDTLVRTRRRTRYRSREPLREVEARLPAPPFFRCHQSFIVNLEHVRELRSRGERDHELKLAPPVNAIIPVARQRLAAFRRAMESKR
jgi:DNA-binding LytR/AlgR family response regulator